MKKQYLKRLSLVAIAATVWQSGAVGMAKPVHTSTRTTTHTASAHQITSAQAVAIIKKRSDVKAFLAQFPQGKSMRLNGLAVVEAEADPNGRSWTVHVFEQLPDHTATMGWFSVDKKTGAVKVVI